MSFYMMYLIYNVLKSQKKQAYNIEPVSSLLFYKDLYFCKNSERD